MSVIEWIFVSILGLIALVVLFFVIKLIFMFFRSWVATKILGSLCSIGAFICGISVFNDRLDNPASWPLIILSIFAYLFGISDIIFDTAFDGWDVTNFRENLFSISFDLEAREIGGFFGNLVAGIAGALIGYLLLAMILPIFYFVIPILLLILNGVFVVLHMKDML